MRKKTGNDPTPRQFVKDMLPDHYDVKETIQGIIRCKSSEGIELAGEWADFMNALKKYFGDSFKEVFHITCHNHINFRIYYNYLRLYNLEIADDGGYKLNKTDKK
jgi:hypothetical protein